MIKNLSGDFETVEYEAQRVVMLYDNTQTEFYPTHWHDAVEIIMPIENEFAVQTGSEEYLLQERDVIIIPPGELHTLPAQPGRRIIFQCDNSVLSGSPALQAILPVLQAPLVITQEYDRELHLLSQRLMLEIFAEYGENTEISDARIYAGLIELLIAVRRFQLRQGAQSAAHEKMNQYSEKFRLVLRYIDQNYMHEITLDTLAGIAGYSKFHFSRLFKQYNNMSYIQYINLRRTRAAEGLLLDRSIPITEVAMRAGFASLSTFNRIFKEFKHCTPSSYQRFYCSAGTPPTTE